MGIQDVMLNGYGTPLNAGSSTFGLTSGTGIQSCGFDLTVNNSGGIDIFSFLNPQGPCGILASSAINVGQPLDGSCFLPVPVTVHVPGPYSITTNTANGMTFSDNGVFTFTGIQMVMLYGSGTPVTAGTHNFIAQSGDDISCTMSVITSN
jgi:hypothetical protein